MINLNEVGARPERDAAGNWRVKFGLYLPGITYNKGYAVKVRIIHDEDQFMRGIEPKDVSLNWVNGSAHDLWEITVPLTSDMVSFPPHPTSTSSNTTNPKPHAARSIRIDNLHKREMSERTPTPLQETVGGEGFN